MEVEYYSSTGKERFMINEKERLIKAMQGKAVDRPPCICPGGMMNMVTQELLERMSYDFHAVHSDARMMADIAAGVYEHGCFENYGVPFCMTLESEAFGAKVDFGNNIYEPHVVEYAIDSVTQWRNLPPITFGNSRAKVVLDAITLLKEKQDGVPIIGNLTGPISVASSVMDPSTYFKSLRKDKVASHELMTFVTDQLSNLAIRMVKAGADIIAISDPSGTGEILGPKLFDEFAVTYLNRLIESIKANKAGTIVHICGQMRPVYKEANGILSDVLSFDSMVSMKEARENLPDRVLMGNVSTYALEFSEPLKIMDLAKKCVDDGSNIISPACGLGMKSPLVNVQAMLKAVKGKDEETDA